MSSIARTGQLASQTTPSSSLDATVHAVIMAGGAGTRFWPASRRSHPKQLLEFVEGKSMIQATVERLDGLANANQISIITNRALLAPIARQLPQLPAEAILGEPCKRDTAPCVGLAAALAAAQDPQATLVVMPADHLIQPRQAFQDAVRKAVQFVERSPEWFVTFGIKPTYPAESFGYIERGPALDDASNGLYQVQKFREKPNAETAREYLSTGNFYWNAGIFVWKAQTILQALAKFEPEMHQRLLAIQQAIGSDAFDDVLDEQFHAIQGKSIDYAVMEHYQQVAVMEAPFEWDDVGNWQTLTRTHGQDDQGNTIIGKHLGIRTSNTIVRSDDHLVVTLGVQDLIVVHTPDATLIAHKHDEESIREVVDELKRRGLDAYL